MALNHSTTRDLIKKLNDHGEAWHVMVTYDRSTLINEEQMAYDCLCAAARLGTLMDIYDQCKAAGFIDESGAVRKVLGVLPVTADGCIPVHGAVVYCPHGGKITIHGGDGYCTCSACWSDGCQGDSGDGTHHKFGKCYSTPEAASAALAASAQAVKGPP